MRYILREAGAAESPPGESPLSREELLAELAALRAMTPPGPRMLAEDLLREIRDNE